MQGLAANPVKQLLIVSSDNPHITAKHPVYFFITGVNQQAFVFQGKYFFPGGYDNDIFFPYYPDHFSADLLVAAAKNITLASNNGNNYFGPFSFN